MNLRHMLLSRLRSLFVLAPTLLLAAELPAFAAQSVDDSAGVPLTRTPPGAFLSRGKRARS